MITIPLAEVTAMNNLTPIGVATVAALNGVTIVLLPGFR